MADYLYPDLCVIGGGPAGLALAAGARVHGAGVLVVEREAMGGNDLFHGTVPARALAESARRAHQIRTASQFGLTHVEPDAQFTRIRDHIAEVRAALSMQVSPARYEAIGARLLKAEAVFVDQRTLSASGALIRARHFVIATGSVPVEPDIPGLEAVPHLTEATIFDNTTAPGHLVVVGGWPYGLELAQAYRRLGADVTLVDPAPLGGSDPELAAVVLRRLAEEGVAFRTGRVAAVAPGPAVILAGGETIAGTHLLVVRGRRPQIDGLDLDAAGLRRSSGDPTRLAVRPNLTTTNSRIFAIGDAAGGNSGQLAMYQAELVVRSALFGDRIRSVPEALPVAVFTDPELAEVGLSEVIARIRLGARFRILRTSFAENPRARLGRRGYGVLKLIAALDGRILGAGIAGPEAAELIPLFAFAVARRLRVADLRDVHAAYPTLAEAIADLAAQDAAIRPKNPVRAAWMALRRVLP